MTRFKYLALSCILGGIVATVAYASPPTEAPVKQDPQETYKMLKLFGEVFERVRSSYVDEISDKELIEKAISGMLANLDPHSSYLNDESFEDMKVQTRGSFGGLGIEVTMDNGLVKVVSPIDDTPAYKAGIKAGDLITHIDGKAVLGLSLQEAVDKMRGKVNTAIKIGVRREGVNEPLNFRIVRDVIRIRSVRYSVYGPVGYIRITTFNAQTEPGLEMAIESIKKEVGKDLLGYVLDLRNNPGGLLDQAIAVSDTFLDEGEIVSTRGRNEEDTKRDNATKGDLAEGKPIVVLINGGSASASEIVAGALQDHRRAVLVGTKSFGKGSVQTIMSLPNDTAIRLTTARYYTPSGRSIQAKGIEPDIEVDQAKLADQTDNGMRISEADLKGALDGEKGKRHVDEPAAAPSDDAKAKEEGDTTKAEPKANPIDHPDLKDDYQLARSIDILRGISLYGSSHMPTEAKAAKDAALSKDKPAADAEAPTTPKAP